MESEVSETQTVARSELDTAFDVGGARGWLVVQSMSTKAWGYVLQPVTGAYRDRLFSLDLELPTDGQRHLRDGAGEA